jgi:hypothetical protein
MADDFIVYNPGGASVFLTNLGVEVPTTEEFDLLQTHDLEVLQADTELAGHLTAGTLRRRIAGTDLSPGDALADAGPVEVAQQAWGPPRQLTVSTNGQTLFNLPTTPVDQDAFVLVVNTVECIQGLDYQFSSPTQIQWLDREYILETNDEVYARYPEAV